MAYSKKMPPKFANCKQPPMPIMPIDHCNIDHCNGDSDCPAEPDLLLLRDAAADERNAIAFYLNAANTTCMDALFLDIAEDEMNHFMETMRLITALDPVQAEMYEEVGMTYMTMPRRPKHQHVKWHPPVVEEEDDDEMEVPPPDAEDLPKIDLITQAMDDELHAINKYQEYAQQAVNPEVRALFCHLMDEEKEHVAELTKCLFHLTHEPLDHEHD